MRLPHKQMLSKAIELGGNITSTAKYIEFTFSDDITNDRGESYTDEVNHIETEMIELGFNYFIDGSEEDDADIKCIKFRADKIETNYDFPALPYRHYDYSAFRDQWDLDDPVGYGSTPEDAIQDLLNLEMG